MKAFKGKNVYTVIGEDQESFLGIHFETDLRTLMVRFGRIAKEKDSQLTSPTHFDRRGRSVYEGDDGVKYNGQTLDRTDMQVVSAPVSGSEWRTSMKHIEIPQKVAKWVLVQAKKGGFTYPKETEKMVKSMIENLVPEPENVFKIPNDLWHEPKVQHTPDDDGDD